MIAAHLLLTLVPVLVLVLGAPRLQTRHVCLLAGLLRFGGCEMRVWQTKTHLSAKVLHTALITK